MVSSLTVCSARSRLLERELEYRVQFDCVCHLCKTTHYREINATISSKISD
ncbi:hypothetical protein [Methanosalsum natronophilum]|uniref:hypothetical protein n=1 Tax=Methanosalsum natronophilum TaxID=768733 RepID=UPI00216979AB|nr:hypothetical protein [Methanosalsum natronophilum]